MSQRNEDECREADEFVEDLFAVFDHGEKAVTAATRCETVSARTNVAAQLNAVQDDTKYPGSVISSKTVSVKLPLLPLSPV